MAEPRFRYDAVMQVLWAGDQSYPATFRSESLHQHLPDTVPHVRMETRAAMVHFENKWCLSTIWGDATYSSNNWYHTPMGGPHPFIEEPPHVEVGVLMPTAIELPAQHFELSTGPYEIPARETTLWGEPLGYVDVPMYHRVAWLVMHLPTDIDLPEGEWDDAQGFCDLLITAGLERTFDG